MEQFYQNLKAYINKVRDLYKSIGQEPPESDEEMIEFMKEKTKKLIPYLQKLLNH